MAQGARLGTCQYKWPQRGRVVGLPDLRSGGPGSSKVHFECLLDWILCRPRFNSSPERVVGLVVSQTVSQSVIFTFTLLQDVPKSFTLLKNAN